jgi:hypothetical protein
MQWTTTVLGSALIAGEEALAEKAQAPAATGADVGSLFLFIRS